MIGGIQHIFNADIWPRQIAFHNKGDLSFNAGLNKPITGDGCPIFKEHIFEQYPGIRDINVQS